MLAVAITFANLAHATNNTAPPEVQITTDKQIYQPDEEVVVTLRNDLNRSITTFNQQAFCSIIKLERLEDDNWTEVRNCFSGAPARDVIIAPNSEMITTLPSLSSGMYQASVVFSIGKVFTFRGAFTASSTPFVVE